MCNPMALMIGMAMVSAVQQNEANRATNKAASAEGASANLAASYNYQQLKQEGQEDSEEAAQKKFQRQIQTERELGTIMVAAGEGGVGGNSVLRLMNNTMLQGTYDSSVIEANRESKAKQLQAEADGVYANAKGRVNVARAKSISPSMGAMNTGMSAIQGGAQGYSMGKSLFGGKTMKTTSLESFKRTGVH